jgi:type IV secretion system protein VirB6
MSGCATVTDLGVVRDVLTAVECNTRSFAQLGYESLTASGSPFQAALTAGLTIYVAVLGYRLLFGNGARLSDAPSIALKIGAVLALVTSWSLFQTLVFDLAQRAPLEIAAVISAPLRGAATDPVAGLQNAYDLLTQTASAFAHPPKSVNEHSQADYAAASRALTLAANALFVSGAGTIAVITIAIGLLAATGPIFIALFLFFETRGFFVGWVRALAACAFGLTSTWSLTIVMLRTTAPWMEALSDFGSGGAGGMADARTGITAAILILVFCAAQLGLFFAGTMIVRGFRLPGRARPAALEARAVAARHTESDLPLGMISRPARLAEQMAHQQMPAAATAGRVALAAAGAAWSRRDAAAPQPERIGDSYRRPAAGRTAGRR